MRVKARAVIMIDGRLIVAEQRRGGRTEHSLPGGRVNERESVLDALKREVAEETGLDVTPGQLVYVSEIVESARRHDLELISSPSPSGCRGSTRQSRRRSGRRAVGDEPADPRRDRP